MTVSALFLAPSENVPGVPVAMAGAPAGSLVTEPGHLQYGRLLTGQGTRLLWRELVGWRNTPGVDVTDAPRPTARGDFPGVVYAQGAVITYTLLLRGTPAIKAAALQVLEDHTQLDGIERPLVVDDGAGPTVRMAKLVLRELPPMDKAFRPGPLEVTLQWRCADPLRYSLERRQLQLRLPTVDGGLDYTGGLSYDPGLDYGDVATGSASVRNTGNAATPITAVFTGPLVRPVLATDRWSLVFDTTLAAGEALLVDAATGRVTLEDADRLGVIAPSSSHVEAALLPPGTTTLTFTAMSGTGTCAVSWADGSA